MPTAGALVLIAEDEPQIAEVLDAYLRLGGFRTLVAEDGERAIAVWETSRPDLVILDIKMPVVDGLGVLAHIRRHGETPVIMVTAMADDLDKILGFRLGADDYVVKPASPAEILERVNAVLRRTMGREHERRVVRFGELQIDLTAMEARADENVLPLTPSEFRLLSHLALRPRRVCTRAELMAACLPQSDAFDRVVDNHISSLRKKLQAAGISKLIVAVRGAGYRFEAL